MKPYSIFDPFKGTLGTSSMTFRALRDAELEALITFVEAAELEELIGYHGRNYVRRTCSNGARGGSEKCDEDAGRAGLIAAPRWILSQRGKVVKAPASAR